jgi:hypothetical protein
MPGLPFILLAAVIQGWSLYGLHHSLEFHHWPATNQAWMMALYALVVFVPLTVQMLAEYARSVSMWRLMAGLAAGYFYFGWHHGTAVFPGAPEPFRGAVEYFPFALVLIVLWLMALPFAQNRLATGRWAIQYPVLFASAWRNKLTLAEAGLFTALFWLLLFLWQTLFHMLGIDYFRELFLNPIFVYPVTSLTFGCALHLIGSIERLTAVVLEQLLNVLKWLALLAGAILVCFTVALVFKLPGLVFTGQKAIGAAWLLWLVAVVVLLLNAAYRDGSVSQPYPKWMALFLRLAEPLTVVISATAFYALMMRSHLYGLTVARVWALIVAVAALLYAVGYARAAFGKGAWFAGIARVNVVTALMLMLLICAALTPLLSPYRLAASSQFRIIRERGLVHAEDEQSNRYGIMQDTPLQYLRFDSGNYGRAKLQELAELQSGPDAESIRLSAKRLLAQTARWEAPPTLGAATVAAAVAKLRIYPAGRTLDQNLSGVLTADLASPSTGFVFRNVLDRAAGLYIDLKRDNSEEFVFLTDNSGLVYENRSGQWVRVGSLYADRSESASRYGWDLFGQLAKGNMAATPPKWNDLSIGDQKFKVNGH